MANYSWPAIGNESAVEFLERSLKNQKVAQTYVFAGQDDLGKSTIALAFARNLQGLGLSVENLSGQTGINSDLHILQPEPDKKSISIEAVREFIKTLQLSSFLNSYNIGIIKQAELLSEEAKSALLKTLEEPKDQVVIILLTAQEDSLPATILSRSQVLYFQPVPAATIYDYLIKNEGAGRALAKDLANLALGKPLAALKWLEHPEVYREYLERAEVWLNLLTLDLNQRLQALDKLFSDKTWSKQATSAAQELLLMAEGLLRDLLLLSLGQTDRLQHSALREKLEQVTKSLPGSDQAAHVSLLLNWLKLIAQAREYLVANVNPRLVLEQVVINI